MSWLARSIANSFKPENNDDVEEEEEEEEDEKQYIVNNNTIVSTNNKYELQVSDGNSRQSMGTGIKEDLSEITKTLTRQFWGVASLIASNERSESPEQEAIAGIRRDFAEIGGRFRSGILKVSKNIDVSGITKLASEFLQVESEDDDDDSSDGDGIGEGAVGVSDEIVAFAGDIAMHPETWLEFPLPEVEDDDEDFNLSDAQQEHALAVECLAPRLNALRIELCPTYMSESSFWKIYFVLLHPRLERHAAELLSTPKIVKARALLAYELKNRSYSETTSDFKSKSMPLDVSAIEKHPIKSDDIQIVDKSVIQEESHERKDEDDWLKEENSEIVSKRVAIPIEDNDDVSFSDLDDDDDDDDDDGNIPIHYKKATYTCDSSTKDSKRWVQLNRSSSDSGKDSDSSRQVSVHNSETKESNVWHDVVDIDVA